ncbi:MAG: serine hydrolase domain-containing protein [Phenylobacterium sp.]|jgi:CubicO group peptidase (beta-lactamase class C family)|uniref:serine hydrolase domain-containing protein n=1 Tax=Phenylobacterium sp. TaxID=1871053 RepID=UPI002A2E6597|nr:serine hydrolase domain-containing protein [Phenylobacterium sp.]MDD3837616.1 serine hydrolase [Phenylobacterium sp.]MDX9997309.1 serine hydrolase domain-containing protein [Phenylobacterium sp.]
MRSAFSKPRLARLSAKFADYVDRGQVPGLVVLLARDDEVHVEVHGKLARDGDAPMQRDSLFRIASLTKPIAAAAAMTFVEEGRIGLDDPVAPWLPELSEPKVLRARDAQVDDVVPAERAITLRDLLTFRLGHGAIMAPPGAYPIQAAQAAAGLAPGPDIPTLAPDEYMRRLGELPLQHQPGAAWRYHTGADVLGVLLARLAGRPLEAVLHERVLEPLGMADTGFHVDTARRPRLTTAYVADPESGDLSVFAPAETGAFVEPPLFPSAGGGLVSTADDLLAFSRMMLGLGRAGRTRVLSRAAVELMTRDHVTPHQKAASPFAPGFWDAEGWGFGLSVVTRCETIGPSVGSYGWFGGYGTSWRADPKEGVTVILLTQRLMAGPDDARITEDFWTLAYQALDD